MIMIGIIAVFKENTILNLEYDIENLYTGFLQLWCYHICKFKGRMFSVIHSQHFRYSMSYVGLCFRSIIQIQRHIINWRDVWDISTRFQLIQHNWNDFIEYVVCTLDNSTHGVLQFLDSIAPTNCLWQSIATTLHHFEFPMMSFAHFSIFAHFRL